jgi:hypothetical protein
MKYTFRLLPLLALLILVASCSKAPEHASYLPKDAQFVISVNTGAMQKKLTWSFITGSDLLKDLRESGAGEQLPAAMSDLQNSGLDFSSTLYFYTKADTRFEGSTRVNAVLPVSSAAKIGDYIRKHIPNARISERGGRQVAMMDKACASWNDKVLILSNIAMHKETVETPASIDTLGGAEIPVEAYTTTQETPDSALTLAELDSAFVKPADNLLADKRFKQLETENHDVSFWISYDQLMNGLRGRQEMSMMSGVLGGSFWENSAMSAGLDFNNGEIVAKGKYFVSDSMRPVAKEFAKENVDAGMLQRVPANGLNMAMGYHLNTAALKMMLDKMGMSAMANMFLADKGMTLEDILGAFTGDMVLAINNFRVETKMQEVDSVMREQYGITPYEVKKPAMDLVFAMKVKDQAKMQRLMGFVSQMGMLTSSAPNVWTLANSSDGSVLMQQNDYLIAGSTQPVAAAFLSANGSMAPAVKQEISGHPYGIWADVNSLVNAAGPLASESASDSMAYNAVKGVFGTFTANGGEFQNDASTFSMKLEFTNKQENSLLQLAQLMQRVAASNKARPVALR